MRPRLAGPSGLPLTARTVFRLVLRRAAGHRRLLAAVIVGVILAVGLMSATEIYRTALRELGVDVDLSRADKTELDLRISSGTHAFASPAYDNAQDLIDARLARIDDALSGATRLAVSSTFFLTDPGAPSTDDPARPRSNLQFFTGLAPHITIDAGHFPGSAPSDADPNDNDSSAAPRTPQGAPLVEVAIGAEAARAFHVSLGDRFDLHPFWRNDLPPIGVTVVGIIRPRDPQAEYWGRRSDQFFSPTANWPTYLFFTTEDTLRTVLPAHIADLDGRIETLAHFDLSAIDAADVAPLARRLRALDRALVAGIERTRVEGDMALALDAFSEKEFFAQVPLLVMTLQIVAIVLYYLVMVAALLVDRQAGEVALLKSRGAGTRHILGIYTVEGLLLAGLGLALGPPLALGAIGLLGLTPAFDGLSDGGLLDVRLTGPVYLWAAVGAGLAFLALLLPAVRISRRSIVQYKQSLSRPDAQSAFHRYYLDLVIVVVAALLFFQLQTSDSLVTEELFGDLTYDPLLLVAPAVFLITVAVVFLRVFPLILRAVDAATTRLSGTAVQLGLWQLMRAPVGHSRLVLLLILATAIGMFAATFGSTLDRSFDDRAAYLAGAPLRLADLRGNELGAETLSAQIEARDDVALASAALRTGIRHDVGATVLDATLLGIEPQHLPDIAWFRDDLASTSLPALLQPLRENTIDPPGVPVPAEAQRIGIWASLSRTTGAIVFLRLRDSQGRYADQRLGPDLDRGAGWQLLTAPLDDFSPGPKTVSAVFIRSSAWFGSFSGEVLWDDLQYSSTTGPPGQPFDDGIVVEDFEAIERWEPVIEPFARGQLDRFSVERSNVISGRSAAQFTWERNRSATPRGIRLAADGAAIAVLANQTFLDDAGLHIGDEFRAFAGNGTIPIRIAGAFELFPTFDPRSGGGMLLADIDRLSFQLNRNASRSGIVSPNEVWIVPSDDAGLASFRRDADTGVFGDRTVLFDTAALRQAQDEDPLTAAGWDGLLFLSFAAVLLLGALGFLVSSLAAARSRALEFAILRTMGFSLRQILAIVSFEQVFIVVLAMAIGTLVGSRLGILMLEFLGVTERGEDVIPPFVLTTDWGTIGVAYGILGAVFLLAIGVVVTLHARLALYRVLRLGE